MLQQTCGLLLHELADHVTKYGADSIEALIGRADVVETVVIEQDLLNNEDGDRLGQLGACLHDPQTERDYLGGQEEVDDLGRVVFDESTDDAEAGQAQVLEGTRLGRGVEEGIEIEGDVRC